jgi:uncharacterized repeat protein (TIGR01451 family)
MPGAEIADVGITKQVKPDSGAVTGQPLSYTLDAYNNGPDMTTSAYVTDVINADGPFSVSGLPASCVVSPTAQPVTNGTAVITCGPLTLAKGQHEQIAYQVTPLTGTTSINNAASISHAGTDPNPVNNKDQKDRLVLLPADVSVVKTGASSVVAGQTLNYTLVASNAGPNVAKDVKIADILPAGMSLVSVSASAGSCQTSGAALNCSVGDLGVGASATVSVVVKVDASVMSGTVLANSAAASSNNIDPNGANNVSTVTTTVTSAATIEVNKSDSPDPVIAGNTVTYKIVVTNSGPSAVSGLMVKDTIAGLANLTYVSASGASCVVDASVPGVVCDAGNLGVGEVRTILVTFKVNAGVADGTVVRDEVSLSSAGGTAITTTGKTTEDTTVQAVAALSVMKVADKAQPGSGEVVKFTVTVKNAGPSDSSNVMVTDTLPVGLAYVNTTCASATVSGQTVVCTIPLVAAGSSVSYDINAQVLPTVTNGSVLVNNVSASGSGSGVVTGTASVQARNVADVGVVKYGKPDGVVKAGEVLTYVVIATNYGPGVAYSATVTDVLASDKSYEVVAIDSGMSCAPGAGVYPAGPTTFTCQVNGALGVNESRVLTMTVKALQDQSINNTAYVSHAGVDPNASNNVAHVQHQVQPEADMSISKSGSPASVKAGELVTYTLVVTNAGPSTAESVVVNDVLPAGVTLVSVTPSQGTCTTSPMSCALGNMAMSTTATIVVVVKTDVTIVSGTVLVNNASVAAATADPNSGNNSATASTTVTRDERLKVTKVDLQDPVTPGAELDYQITVVNVGASAVSNQVVVDTLPGVLTWQSYTVSPGNKTVSCTVPANPPNVTNCTIVGDLLPGESVVITIKTLVDPGAVPPMTITNVIAGDAKYTSDSDLTEDTSLVPKVDVSVKKTADKTQAAPGEIVRYTIEIKNAGPSVATNVRLTDTLPYQVDYVYDSLGCGAGLANCLIGTLAVGESKTVEVQVRVSERGWCRLPMLNRAVVSANEMESRYDNNASEVNVYKMVCMADLRVTKVAKPDADQPTAVGGLITYTVFVENLGPNAAHDVDLVDDMLTDASFEVVSINANADGGHKDANCHFTAGAMGVNSGRATLVCNPGTSATGANTMAARDRWLVQVVVRATAEGDINNLATVSSDGDTIDADQSNNQAYVERHVGCTQSTGADLKLSGSTDKSTVSASGSVASTLSWVNLGVGSANCVTLVQSLPANTSFDASKSSAGWTRLGTTNYYVLSVGTVGVYGTGSAVFAVQVSDAAVVGSAIDLNAEVRSSAGESVTTNNTVSVSVSVVAATTPAPLRTHTLFIPVVLYSP